MDIPWGRYPQTTLLHPSCFDHFGLWGPTKSRPQRHTLYKSRALGQSNDHRNDHKDKRSNKWSYHKWSTQWSFHSNTQHVALPNWEYIADNLQLHNLWARTSQRRALSKRINSPPPNRYIFNRNQSHRLKSNVRHTVHLQVRSGSERNRRHLVPRISIDLQVRLDDHQLIPSSWVYGPIKIISNYPNDVKTSGLRSPSSSSTPHRISYSEWDKPGLSE